MPFALELIGPSYDTPEARAMLLAIAMQESGCLRRTQIKGPAKSFWQFELIGIIGLFNKPKTAAMLTALAKTLTIEPDPISIHTAIEHNDVLAIVCARRLLSHLPQPLPTRDQPDMGWEQYKEAWLPGTPRPATWRANWIKAWDIVDGK